MALNACTIVSKNYICYARVLCHSFLEHHPDGRFFVLLVDRNDGHIDASKEAFTLLEAEELSNIPELRAFLFKYTLLECNTAVKPYLLEKLIDEHGLENLVYFDPDILITGSLRELDELIQRHSVVLTPHLTDPIDDDAYPGEQAILQSGTYNLGFVALRADETSRRLLRWWQERLFDRCVVRIADGLFVDQKWMDLVPGLYENVHVHRHPGYNVAYWNLHGRTVEITEEGPTSNGEPLVFFHFSGIRPESLDGVSKHQDRFTLDQIGGAADLYRLYARKVIDAGYFDCRTWPYAFKDFSNGVAIPDSARALFLELERSRQRAFGDPFEAGSSGESADGSFFAYLQSPASRRSPLTRFLEHLHRSRPELRAAFADPAGEDFTAYRAWLYDVGRHQLRLDEAFLDALPKESAAEVIQHRGLTGGVKRKVKNLLKRLYHGAPGRLAKGALRKALGAERTRNLRQRLRPTPPPAPASVASPSRLVIEKAGVNLVGYLDAETGMGEAGRGLARALDAAGVPSSRHTLGLGVLARRADDEFAAGDVEAGQVGAGQAEAGEADFPHDINLFVINADQVLPVREHLGPQVFEGRYNIGLWLWELEDFPRHLEAAFEPLDEIWTPSTFCLDALAKASPIPVRRMPLPLKTEKAEPGLSPSELRNRAHFGIEQGRFVALYIFNYLSYAERKNPIGAVRAFKKAFGDDDSKLLVLKTSQKDFAPESHRALEAAIDGAPNIRLIDDYLSRREIDSLMHIADVYLSLHRSEGYGLTLAEAMLHGTPVIATPYSGVTDFFDSATGWPVRYEMVELGEAAGPYPAGSRWADPDIEHAAEILRQVADDPDERERRAERARRRILRELSPQAVGRQLSKQVDRLLRRHKPIPAAGMGR